MTIPYLVKMHPDIRIIPLITVPEAAPNGYRMAGVPDGIGAFINDPQQPHLFDVLVTHELRYNQGGVRLHAPSGAFISRWRFDASALSDTCDNIKLLWGEDLIGSVEAWSHADSKYRTAISAPLERLCSANLPAQSALLYTDKEGNQWGTEQRLFLGGEETHTKFKPEFGRAFAHVVPEQGPGVSYELPRLGRGSWENVLACPTAQRKTIAILPDDATSNQSPVWQLRSPTSELYIYVGLKGPIDDPQEPGPHEKAGLDNGTLYGVQVYLEDCGTTINNEDDELGFGGSHNGKKTLNTARFRLIDLGNRSIDDNEDVPGIALQKASLNKQITRFLRPEDGAWDPRADKPGHFWFATTGDVDKDREPRLNSRLFHLTFDDITEPEKGGRIDIEATARVNGKWQFRLLDSVCIDRAGRIFMQEDPDSANALSRTLVLDKNRQPKVVATANPDLFDKNRAKPNALITTNEEAAGIVPMDDILGEGWYLTAVQCNSSSAWTNITQPVGMSAQDWEQLKIDLAYPGQLLAIYIPPDIEDDLPDTTSACCQPFDN